MRVCVGGGGGGEGGEGVGEGGGALVIRSIGHTDMCRPLGYGFLVILVWKGYTFCLRSQI